MLAGTGFPLSNGSSMNARAKGKAIQQNDFFGTVAKLTVVNGSKGASRTAYEVEFAGPVNRSVGLDRNSGAVVGSSAGLRVGIGAVC
jgi:hypothetical protein